MSYKDIVVHMDDTPAAERRADLAASLAAGHGAHLRCAFIDPPLPMPPYVAAQAGAFAYDAHNQVVAAARQSAEARFRSAVKAAGVQGEFLAAEGYAPDVVTAVARYADLAILGQDDPDIDAPYGFQGLAEQVLLAAGRPILVVPYSGDIQRTGRRVVVAWNGGREAARAVHDALPFLVEAEMVTVLVLETRRTRPAPGDLPGSDISQHLARHGVRVTSDAARTGESRLGGEFLGFAESDMEAGDLLLSRVADLSADLLVMGGYGHSRMHELILGGLTRRILATMTVPVLLSH